MRPDATDNPTVESVEEVADVGALVVLAPAAQERVEPRNQLLSRQRRLPFRTLPYPIPEATDRFLLGIRIQRPLSGLTANLAHGQSQLRRPALDFVAQELEPMPDVNDPRLLRMNVYAQLFQNSASSIDSSSRLRRRLAGHDPVVCVPRQLIPSQSHLPIERCQENVTERW